MMPGRVRKYVLAVGLVATGAIASGGFYLYSNLDDLRGYAERELSAASGRDIQLAGGLSVSFGLKPKISANGVLVSNPDWASRENMLSGGHLDAELAILPLVLGGNIKVHSLTLRDAHLDVEMSEDGQLNWDLAAGDRPVETGGVLEFEFDFRRLSIRDSQLTWQNLDTIEDGTAKLESLTFLNKGRQTPILFDGRVQYEDTELAIEGQTGSLANVLANASSYPLDLSLNALGPVEFKAKVEDGQLTIAAEKTKLTMPVVVQGTDVRELGPFLGLDLPDLGSWTLETLLTVSDSIGRVSGLTAMAGKSGLGAVEITNGEGSFRATNETFSAVLKASGPTTDPLDTLIGEDLPNFGAWTGTTNLALQGNTFHATELTFESSTEDNLFFEVSEGRIMDTPEKLLITLPISADGKSTRALGKLIEFDLPEFGPFQLTGLLEGNDNDAALSNLVGQADAGASELIRITDGEIQSISDGTGIDLAVRASGQSVRQFGQRFDAQFPELGPYNLSGRLAGTFDQLTLAGVSGPIGRKNDIRVTLKNARLADLAADSGLHAPLIVKGPDLRRAAGMLDMDIDWPVAFSLETTLKGRTAEPEVTQFDARLHLGNAEVHAAGSVGSTEPLSGLQLTVDATGESLSDFSVLAGVSLPRTAKTKLKAAVTGIPGNLVLGDVVASIGETTAQGTLTIDTKGRETPFIEGWVLFPRLDPEALVASFANTGNGDDVLPVNLLDDLEMAVKLQTNELVIANETVRNVNANMTLKDGKLALRKINARISGGDVEGRILVDSPENRNIAEVTTLLNIEDVQLSKLLAGENPYGLRGRVDFDINVDTIGRSLDELAAHIDGDAFLFAEEGQVKDVPINSLVQDFDIFHLLPFFGTTGSTVRINCALGEFEIEDSLAETKAMLDTRRMTILGQGSIDLSSQNVKLTLEPSAKSSKLSKTAVPVDIVGPISDPDIRPQVDEAAGGILGSLLGGLLVPLNQLSSIFGDKAKSACGDALARVREMSEQISDSP